MPRDLHTAPALARTPEPTPELRSTGVRRAHTVIGVFAVITAASAVGLAVNSPRTADAAGTYTITVDPVADTYVTSGAPASVRGHAVRIQASDQPDHHKLAYLRFALPAVSRPITGATLELTRDTHHLDSVVYADDVANSSWSEGSTDLRERPAPRLRARLGVDGQHHQDRRTWT